jgi:hypothetical protein
VRRIVILLACIGMLVTALAGSASARSLTVHRDPNDTPRTPDIRRVWTGLPPFHVYIRIGAWERMRRNDARFAILLDTHGSYGFDRVIEISGGVCVVEGYGPDGLGGLIGKRDARRPGGREIACNMPRSWFGIHRIVRTVVFSETLGEENVDRAPNEGRYLGL